MIHDSGSTLKPHLHTHIRIHTLMHTPHTRITHICTHTQGLLVQCVVLSLMPHRPLSMMTTGQLNRREARPIAHVYTCTCIHVYVREMQKEGRKKQARSYKQQRKATQHTKAVTFPKKKKELPRVYVLVLVLFAYMYNYYTCACTCICTHILYMYTYIEVLYCRATCCAAGFIRWLNHILTPVDECGHLVSRREGAGEISGLAYVASFIKLCLCISPCA